MIAVVTGILRLTRRRFRILEEVILARHVTSSRAELRRIRSAVDHA